MTVRGALRLPTAAPSPAAFAASSPLVGRGGMRRWASKWGRDSRLRGNDGYGWRASDAGKRKRGAGTLRARLEPGEGGRGHTPAGAPANSVASVWKRENLPSK